MDIDIDVSKKFETLADLYKGFRPFRVGIRSLHKSHSDFMRHMRSKRTIRDCYSAWNDEAVEFCFGILFTAFALEYIDSDNYDYFICVLRRYKSYNFG